MAFLIKRKEKFMRETVRNEDGSSLISVIVAFVILTLGILMVTTAVKVSLDVTNQGLANRSVTEAVSYTHLTLPTIA